MTEEDEDEDYAYYLSLLEDDDDDDEPSQPWNLWRTIRKLAGLVIGIIITTLICSQL